MDNVHHEMQEPEHSWRMIEEQYKNGEPVSALVINCHKAGLIVDVAGIRGFVPISQLVSFMREEVVSVEENQEMVASLQSMKGRQLQLKIIEINRARKRLILSERLAIQQWRQRRREELLDELKPGDLRRGVVINLANFGAFVDLGGAEGLVHISQLAWSRVNHPSEILHIGQEVEVQVLSVDKEKKKIALSIKRAGKDEIALKEVLAEGIAACPSCKCEVQPFWKHCMYCGLSLTKVCPNCGAPRIELVGVRFCSECGGLLE